MFETKVAPTQASNNKSYSIQITTIRINSVNFLCWSLSMMMYICGQVKISYLTSEKKASAREDPTYATWNAENSTIMIWLVNSKDGNLISNYMCYSTTKKLQNDVNQMYSDLGIIPRFMV